MLRRAFDAPPLSIPVPHSGARCWHGDAWGAVQWSDLEKGVSEVKSGERLEQGFLGSGGGAIVPTGLESVQYPAMRGPAGSGPPYAAVRWRLAGPSLAVNLV